MSDVHETILRCNEVRKRLGGISETSFWRLRKKDSDFPKPVIIRGTSIKGWHQSEINQWIIENPKEVE